MERALILLVAALMVYVAPGVQGTSHLSFANNTEVNINRTGCGVTKLCVETPDKCDPTGNNSCLFVSVVANTSAPNGTDLSIELRGDSTGYIALGLTVNASQGNTMLFICAQNTSNNGSFLFRTMQRNNSNNNQSLTERNVTDIRGMVNGSVIKCKFNVPNVNATQTKANGDTTFSVLLGNGTFDGSIFGAFNVTLKSGPLNLADPTSNVATTTAPTTSGSGAVHPHAVLLLLSVLTLSVLLRA